MKCIVSHPSIMPKHMKPAHDECVQAEAQNAKNVTAKVNKARAKAQPQRASKDKRAKKEEGVLALIKTEEEAKLLEEQQKDSEWVKARNTAHKAFLAAGHTEEAIGELLKAARATLTKNPLGRSTSDSNEARASRGKEELR